jgi:hypothetical protein
MSQSDTQQQTSSSTTNIEGLDPQVEDLELPTTLEEALEVLKELRLKRNKMLQLKYKTAKEIEKLQKEKTMLDLRLLVPRELFRTEDRYNEELEKVLAEKGGKNKVVLMKRLNRGYKHI